MSKTKRTNYRRAWVTVATRSNGASEHEMPSWYLDECDVESTSQHSADAYMMRTELALVDPFQSKTTVRK